MANFFRKILSGKISPNLVTLLCRYNTACTELNTLSLSFLLIVYYDLYDWNVVHEASVKQVKIFRHIMMRHKIDASKLLR